MEGEDAVGGTAVEGGLSEEGALEEEVAVASWAAGGEGSDVEKVTWLG